MTTLVFIALALLQAYRFKATRDKWRLPMCLFWGALAGYSATHSGWLAVVTAVLLVAALVLKFFGYWRLRLAIDRMRLRRLSPEEEAFRKTLTQDERSTLELEETLAEKRYTLDEAREWATRTQTMAKKEKAAADKRRTREAAEKAGEEAIAAEEREMKEVGLLEKAEVHFRLSRPTKIHASEGKHTVPAGEYSGTVSLRPDEAEDEFAGTPVECVFEFTHEGSRWRSETWLRTSYLSDLQRPELAKKAVFWKDAPADWKATFQTRCLIADITVFDDGRERFDLKIEGEEFCVMTKYLTWKLALALTPDGQHLLVRVHALNSELWKDDNSSGEDRVFVDFKRVPPFCAQLPVEALLPITKRKVHGIEKIDDWEDEEPIEFAPVRI